MFTRITRTNPRRNSHTCARMLECLPSNRTIWLWLRSAIKYASLIISLTFSSAWLRVFTATGICIPSSPYNPFTTEPKLPDPVRKMHHVCSNQRESRMQKSTIRWKHKTAQFNKNVRNSCYYYCTLAHLILCPG